MISNKPKGTRDFLPKDTLINQIVEQLLRQTAETFSFREIRTPIFEHTEVFERSSGESSDIVNKEMYTFLDKGGRSISLRPEGTAGVVRSFVENKMYVETDFPVRLYYCGPNFRYERPQAGRYRQFSQFGLENIGIRSPFIDAENIFLAVDMLASVGITDIKLKINSIGDKESRNNYKEALKEYFKPYLNELCEDCKVRYEKNPLRILDCKVDANHECMKGYPAIKDYLSKDSKDYFAKVLDQLDLLNIEYEIDDKLVRGLDYYNDVVFEIEAIAPSGTNYGAILGGGRYDELVEQFGGPSLPAFGFGIGLDRVVEVVKELHVMDEYKDYLTCYVMPREETSIEYGFFVTNFLRSNGVDCDMDYQARSIKSQFKTVDRKNALYSIIVGEDEAKTQQVSVRKNATKEQVTIPLNALMTYLREDINSSKCECGCHHDDEEHECCCGHHHEGEEHECCCEREHDSKEHKCDCNEEGCCCNHKEN